MQDWRAEKAESESEEMEPGLKERDLSIIGIAAHVGEVGPNEVE